MRYILRLRLENFQSHPASELEFKPGLNVIVGPSDNGKTAVLRALRWALYNEPGGSEFIRHGTRECRVQVTMSDGTVILRERTPKVNRYMVTAPGEAPQVFEGFGARVPAEVLRAHGMAPVALDTDRRVLLNLGGQLDGPFLLAEPASLRAKAIGRLLGVHVVDAAARLARRDLQALARREKALDEEVARLDGQLAAFAGLPRWEQDLQAAEAALAGARERAARVQELQRLGQALQEVDAALAGTRDLLSRLRSIYPAEQKVAAADQARDRAARLGALAGALAAATGELERTGRELAATAGAPGAAAACEQALAAAARLARVRDLRARWDDVAGRLERGRQFVANLAGVPAGEERWQQAEALGRRLGRLRPLQEALAAAEAGARSAGAEVSAATGLLRTLAREYETLLHRLGRCPTCLSPVTPDTLRRIAREINPAEEDAADAG